MKINANQAANALENSRLVEQIVRSEQLSTIGKMAAFILHNFKGPLSVMQGCAELLADPRTYADGRGKFVEMIMDDIDDFVGKSRELLDYSRGTLSLALKPVNLVTVLLNLAESIKGSMLAANIRMKTDIRFDGEVQMDEPRFKRALQNLVGNAVGAMPDGGDLTIEGSMEGDVWRLSVTDTEHGIPLEIRTRIFQPFVTQGKEYGTGLGLAMAKEIVEGHGGGLGFKTRTKGEVIGHEPGTTFVIEVPLAGASGKTAP